MQYISIFTKNSKVILVLRFILFCGSTFKKTIKKKCPQNECVIGLYIYISSDTLNFQKYIWERISEYIRVNLREQNSLPLLTILNVFKNTNTPLLFQFWKVFLPLETFPLIHIYWKTHLQDRHTDKRSHLFSLLSFVLQIIGNTKLESKAMAQN